MGYDIVTLETQNHGQDWPLIVTAVACPTCGAAVGEMCHAVGTTQGPTATNPLVNTGQQRIDWHADRKLSAAAAWYTRDTSAHQPPAPPAPGEESILEPPSDVSEDASRITAMAKDLAEDLSGAGPAAFAGDKTKTATGKKKSAPPPPPPPPSK